MSVVVVIPVRDGAHVLADCLAAIKRQTRTPDEVLVVMGPSRDDTRGVAVGFADDGVRILDNPDGDRASGINAALDATGADLVALVDAQSRLAPEYLQFAEQLLADDSIAVIGGPMRPVGSSGIGQSMAAALQSPFGVGDSQFHFTGMPRDVESVYLGVYRRSVFDRIGRYNSALLRTEDDDLNARIREVGLRIRLDPAIRSTYRCRETLAEIWHQYHGYGFWKVALATVRPSAIRWRHLIPAAFVVALISGGVLAILGSWLPLVGIAAMWAMAAVVFAIQAPAASMSARLLFPVVALTMHLAYGAGTLWGVIQWPRLAKRVRGSAVQPKGTPR